MDTNRLLAPKPAPAPVVCIGGATVDRKLRTLGPLHPGTSNPVRSERTFGGVARNVAEGLARLDVGTALVSAIGDDEAGRSIVRHLREAGVDVRFIAVLASHVTAEYLAILPPSGDLAYGLAEMAILDGVSIGLIEQAEPAIASASLIFADCNLPADVLAALLRRPQWSATPLAVDAVSVAKVRRLPDDLSGLDLLFLNRDEAEALLGPDEPASAPEDLAAALLARGARQVILTLGPSGLLAATAGTIAFIPAVPAETVDATGAGDALTATVLAGLVAGEPLEDAARRGALAAALTIESPFSVRPDLSQALLATQARRAGGRCATRRGSHD